MFDTRQDYWLLGAIAGIILLGFIMVVSASIVIADREFGQPFYYGLRHLIYLSIGFLAAFIVYKIPMRVFRKIAPLSLLVAFILLLMVLIPGIGRTVNGSSRWLYLGPVSFQVSEWLKFSVILYISDYLVRHQYAVQNTVAGFLWPMGLLSLLAVLLLKQPDFGATFVMMATALGLLFLGGVPLRQFIGLLCLVVMAFVGLAMTSPYRLQRLTSFLDPWANQFDSGYQLTQALIAFGRGEWFGVGLGGSIQKLLYLPEAHTDFLYAILAEELGLLGSMLVILLYGVIVYRGMNIGLTAHKQGKYFSSYAAYGVVLWIGLQAFINIGVNTGVLPTKGLTLPLMSYGGSSLVVICMALGLLLRVDKENQGPKKGPTKVGVKHARRP
jgi:cell division protein FtsW